MRARKSHAVLLPLVVVLVAIPALVLCFNILLNKTQGVERRLGTEQFRLLEVYQFGTDFQQYLSQAGKYSAQQSIARLSDVGWHAVQPDCGAFNGYILWNSKGRDCYPTGDSMKLSMSVMFSNLLKEYTRPYLGDSIISYSLDLSEKDNSLLIRAIPANKIDFVIGANDEPTALNPNIRAINLGDSLDTALLSEKIKQAEQKASSPALASSIIPPEPPVTPEAIPSPSGGGP